MDHTFANHAASSSLTIGLLLVSCVRYSQEGRQEAIHFLEEPIRFSTGKSIVVDCVFDSSAQESEITFGMNAEEEMCQFRLLYRTIQTVSLEG